jgi:hypothetical protein
MSQIITTDDFIGYLDKTLIKGIAQQVVDAVNAYVGRVTNRSTGYPGQTQDTYDPGGYYVNPLGRLTFNSSPSGLSLGLYQPLPGLPRLA